MFHATPLSEIAQEFNRYNRLQIRVEGRDAQQLQFWGVFDADKPTKPIGRWPIARRTSVVGL